MNEFDDSLDGSITKPKINPLHMDVLEEPERKPNAIELKIRMGEETEDKILKMFENEKYLSAIIIVKKYGMPARTAGTALTRLKRKGVLKSEYKMLKSDDGKNRLNNVYTLVKRNE